MQSSFARVLSLPPARRRHRRLPSRTRVSAIWNNKKKEEGEEEKGGRQEKGTRRG